MDAARSPGQDVRGERVTGFFQQGHDTLTLALGPPDVHLTRAPTNVIQLESSHLLAPQARGGE